MRNCETNSSSQEWGIIPWVRNQEQDRTGQDFWKKKISLVTGRRWCGSFRYTQFSIHESHLLIEMDKLMGKAWGTGDHLLDIQVSLLFSAYSLIPLSRDDFVHPSSLRSSFWIRFFFKLSLSFIPFYFLTIKQWHRYEWPIQLSSLTNRSAIIFLSRISPRYSASLGVTPQSHAEVEYFQISCINILEEDRCLILCNFEDLISRFLSILIWSRHKKWA